MVITLLNDRFVIFLQNIDGAYVFSDNIIHLKTAEYKIGILRKNIKEAFILTYDTDKEERDKDFKKLIEAMRF